MSLAVAKAVIGSKEGYSDLSENVIVCMQGIGRQYSTVGMVVCLEDGCFQTILRLIIVLMMEQL